MGFSCATLSSTGAAAWRAFGNEERRALHASASFMPEVYANLREKGI
jgi:hypothetical protein